jgi:predicted transposase YbfD/YdcC
MKPTSSFFAGLNDPRVERNRLHEFDEIIFIAFAAIICGAETWNEIADFGRAKCAWLKTFLKLENGVPSHDTFNRVFGILNSAEFEAWFIKIVCRIAKRIKKEVIAVDGKSMRGTAKKGKEMVHMVSAWANSNQLVLGQRKVYDKSNEITAIPELLKSIYLEDCVVTIDAMGCQKAIAQLIVENKADYILAVKGNQKELFEDIKDSFKILPIEEIDEEISLGHGRIEKRRCTVITDLSLITNSDEWVKLKSLIRIQSERTNKTTLATEKQERYYISSLTQPAKTFNSNIRSHWGIENSLHWKLDVSFGEDKSRKREGNAAENYSIMNRLALNLLKSDKTSTRSIKGKRLRAGWDLDYLKQILLLSKN